MNFISTPVTETSIVISSLDILLTHIQVFIWTCHSLSRSSTLLGYEHHSLSSSTLLGYEHRSNLRTLPRIGPSLIFTDDEKILKFNQYHLHNVHIYLYSDINCCIAIYRDYCMRRFLMFAKVTNPKKLGLVMTVRVFKPVLIHSYMSLLHAPRLLILYEPIARNTTALLISLVLSTIIHS